MQEPGTSDKWNKGSVAQNTIDIFQMREDLMHKISTQEKLMKKKIDVNEKVQ